MINNRFSIFKDASGYLNYKVIDKNGNSYIVSTDVSDWKAGEQHHIATSWILNSKTNQDELHLFIDGKEASNIIKYGGHVSPRLHQKFRTISTEEIIGEIPKNIVGSTDLITEGGYFSASSSLNFTDLGIETGDILYIEETGFDENGYTISNVNGNTLTLSTSMPISATNCKFTINKVSFIVSSQINLYKNIAISIIKSILDGNDLLTTAYSYTVSSAYNFNTYGVSVGDLLKINEVGFEDYYIITDVSDNTLTLSDNMPLSTSNSNFTIYSTSETELPGQNALFPYYEISRDGYFNNILTIKAGVESTDILLLRTLGLNHSRTKNKYYLWGNELNVLNTRLPSPLYLDDVKIYHTLLDTTIIGPSNSILSGGIFTSDNISTDQPSASDTGRTLSITISGDNIDYTSDVSVLVDGYINGNPLIEIITFSENITKDTSNKFTDINYINVICTPINSNRSCLTIKIKEKYPITFSENSNLVAAIKYSYQMLVGNTLSGTAGSSTVTDASIQFSVENIGNYLKIYSPPSVIGQYLITDVSDNLTSITLDGYLADTFIDGNYEILNVSSERSGLQNGRFIFEEAQSPGIPYYLNKGLYELDYHSGLSIPINIKNLNGFIGSDTSKNRQANSIIDDFFISGSKLSDTRVGEILQSGADSITKHYNSLKALKPNYNTLMLLDFDTSEFTNNTDVYLTSSKSYIQSSMSVNSNFNKSIIFTDTPLLIDNSGILNTKTEGTIEFWINPLNDTGNDPNYRFYFDASGIVTEKVISINNATVSIAGRALSILNIKLQNGMQNIDYFAGGTIDSDLQTLFLNKKLPNQQTPVVVTYIPTGISGDRISIFKDPYGYINFNITGNGSDHQVRAPIFWAKNTWHRIKAQYKVNQGINTDEIRLFIDGYEYGNILLGNGLLFGEHAVFGSSYVGHNSIRSTISFTDPINEFTIGSDYSNVYGANALIDNLRISNISRPIFSPFGEPVDPNYSTNLNIVYPVTEDLYTTYLLDFNKLIEKTTDFAVLKNKKTGLSDITINVYDSFNILKNNEKSKEVMETLLKTLKPAGSRLFISYK